MEIAVFNRKVRKGFRKGRKHRIRNHPLVPETIPINGFIYDVHSGELVEVEGAQDRGQAA